MVYLRSSLSYIITSYIISKAAQIFNHCIQILLTIITSSRNYKECNTFDTINNMHMVARRTKVTYGAAIYI